MQTIGRPPSQLGGAGRAADCSQLYTLWFLAARCEHSALSRSMFTTLFNSTRVKPTHTYTRSLKDFSLRDCPRKDFSLQVQPPGARRRPLGTAETDVDAHWRSKAGHRRDVCPPRDVRRPVSWRMPPSYLFFLSVLSAVGAHHRHWAVYAFPSPSPAPLTPRASTAGVGRTQPTNPRRGGSAADARRRPRARTLGPA